ncbi:MAG: inorganic diphosphatase [Zoogloeaceae bacterium]|jgi:inorganic pyrophosphatase|nr:inorganic diphosphatase [Zoogloeaceae bacterium]
MNIEALSIGEDIPNAFNVIIEIPAHTPGIKYELDKASGCVLVDRFMATPMHYPCDYGFIPHTLADDGDPVDALVVAPCPLQPGVVVTCRPLGMLAMEDEAGVDAKLVAVPASRLTPLYDQVRDIDDLQPLLLQQIAHFFAHYKDLENGKWVKVQGWQGVAAAKAEILAGVDRFEHSKKKPNF